MSLSRSGFELNEIWHWQIKSIVEADAADRARERKMHGDPKEEARHRRSLLRRGHAELIRTGRSDVVMSDLVDKHHKAKSDYDKARAPRASGHPQRWPEEITDRYIQARRAVHNHYHEHGDHPADHARRGEGETPRQFGDRLVDVSLSTGTTRPGGNSEHDHGSLSYDNRHDKDKQLHYRHRDAMARAWEREIPEGHAERGDRTRGDERRVVGSYVHFRTGPRPQQRRRR